MDAPQVAPRRYPEHAPEVYHEVPAPEVYRQAPVDGKKEALSERPYSAAPRAPKKWCGLRPRVALMIVALTLLAVVGLVGGLVGGLATRSRSSGGGTAVPTKTGVSSTSSDATTSGVTATSTTATSTSSAAGSSTGTSTTAFPSTTNNVLPLNCPAINNTQLNTGGQSFFIYCLMDFITSTSNIAQSLQPSISACISSCAEYNTNNSNELPCQGLTFGANLTRFANANCFLKTGPLTNRPYDGADQAGAILLG